LTDKSILLFDESKDVKMKLAVGKKVLGFLKPVMENECKAFLAKPLGKTFASISTLIARSL
jgi:hypothetical protein